MTTQPQITIVGLGLIGASLGLALKRQQQVKFVITGHDRSDPAVQRAKKLGAIDTSHWNLTKACEKADLVVLAVPFAAVAPTLTALADTLRPGCLVIDTTHLKAPVLDAAAALPDTVHFIPSNPVLLKRGPLTIDAAAADLFDKAPWALSPAANASPEAVNTASELIRLTGGQPFFLDPVEHDGLMAAVDGLPAVLAAALLDATTTNPAWREMRRLAGAQFDAASYLPASEGADLAELLATNSQSIIQWIGFLQEQLALWKRTLQDGDKQALTTRLEAVTEARALWQAMRLDGDFEEREPMQKPPGFWDRFISLPSRRPPTTKTTR